MELKIVPNDDGSTTLVREGRAIEFKEMMVRLQNLQYETPELKEEIRNADAEEGLRVTLTANSPLKVISVEKISL